MDFDRHRFDIGSDYLSSEVQRIIKERDLARSGLNLVCQITQQLLHSATAEEKAKIGNRFSKYSDDNKTPDLRDLVRTLLG